MMNRVANCAVVAAAISTLLACAPTVPFTTAHVAEYNLQPKDLEQIQFYLSDQLVLVREADTKDTRQVTGQHRLRKEKGKLIEEVIFLPGTPGVVVTASDDMKWVGASFEPSFTIIFKTLSVRPDGPDFVGSRYYLAHEDTKTTVAYVSQTVSGTRVVYTPRQLYEIEYGPHKYGIKQGDKVFLEIHESDLFQIERRRRQVEGIRLPNR